MTNEQKAALDTLLDALRQATDTGLLDELAAHVHPDTINSFCDAVTEVASQEATVLK